MTRAWKTLDRVPTDAGQLELRERGEGDFLIAVDGRVLMNSRSSRSEEALGRVACLEISGRDAPRVLIGGLGMGFTLRAALDVLPGDARVVVAEITSVVAEWCRGPLAALTGGAVSDSRVELEIGDVTARIASASSQPRGAFDAILLDLYEGPHAGRGAEGDPFFGTRALRQTRAALRPGGVFALWSEHRDAGFERRMRSAGFDFELQRPGRGGLRHAVYLARARTST